jgi:hypothetical protein
MFNDDIITYFIHVVVIYFRPETMSKEMTKNKGKTTEIISKEMTKNKGKGKITDMRRPFEKIRDINDSKSLWRIAVRVKDLWLVRHGKSNKQHLEMVICDDLVISLIFN